MSYLWILTSLSTDAVPCGDVETGHVEIIGGQLKDERLIELRIRFLFNYICLLRLNNAAVTHQTDLYVEVYYKDNAEEVYMIWTSMQDVKINV